LSWKWRADARGAVRLSQHRRHRTREQAKGGGKGEGRMATSPGSETRRTRSGDRAGPAAAVTRRYLAGLYEWPAMGRVCAVRRRRCMEGRGGVVVAGRRAAAGVIRKAQINRRPGGHPSLLHAPRLPGEAAKSCTDDGAVSGARRRVFAGCEGTKAVPRRWRVTGPGVAGASVGERCGSNGRRRRAISAGRKIGGIPGVFRARVADRAGLVRERCKDGGGATAQGGGQRWAEEGAALPCARTGACTAAKKGQ